jgi:hypothetical protein
MVRATRVFITINNYTDEHIDALNGIDCKYIVYGREVAPTTGTPHLHAFIIFHNARSLVSVSTELGGSLDIQRAQGTSQEARAYCKKDGNFIERGDTPTGGERNRSDVHKAVAWVKQFVADNGRAPTEREIAVEQPVAFMRYPRMLLLGEKIAPPPVLVEGNPRTWQAHLEEELLGDADDRQVKFLYDPEGNVGKTWFSHYFFSKHPDITQLLGPGRREDMTYTIDASKSVFFINVPRGSLENLQYTVLEMLKDKVVFSSKYQSCVKYLDKRPHVIVMTNEWPDMEKMSADRYDIIQDFENNITEI